MATTTAATLDPHEPAATPSAGKGRPTGDDQLQCVVVTPERTLFDERVDFVALPLYDGELGILPGRAPLIGRLGDGVLRTHTGATTTRYFIEGGFAQVRDDIVTVLTSRAIPADAIDVPTATDELEKARSRPATTEAEQAEKQRAIARARAKLRLAERLR